MSSFSSTPATRRPPLRRRRVTSRSSRGRTRRTRPCSRRSAPTPTVAATDLTPPDIAAEVLAVELDPVGGIVGAGGRVGHRRGAGGHDEDAPPGGDQAVAVAAGPGVKDLDPGKLRRLVPALDRLAGLVGARVSA